MKVKKQVKLILDENQLKHIIRSYFGFTMDDTRISSVVGTPGDHDYSESRSCPTLCVLAIEEVETP